ncbi:MULTISPECIES: high frequency lysogenization protein HflD [unclassified Colwellia]|uniref:high frequency lysogenization protein HflD n=1 Tax=unclassified Colwellia TaxID=196834 RepID=UPI0015F54A2B|nr:MULTISPECIES: high frequency lysogenization protein HflD [unclassified Colwellia]MBA6233522.1 high frequency lysogenization protein HflD [Colwellia sp. MB02u-7]MBA6238082.1 high frequency lysogenization protein HflD [Colwellia sp. MB02u-11]MBA6257311.1 high frequency lysogenization protein HflD [Colwellia sp. MB3u-28]MBA6258895.1 high frequency lysogenization protein HflD [Colwellia sp. MB3u-41]MBA6299781.1 high frequency lysogenization protein HflD [Colwellia sp. MB3u-22]
MNSINEQTLTLAAVCQVAYWVQKISRSGQIDEDELALLLNSVMITSPENTMEVYGGEISHLKTGLTTLVNHLGNKSTNKDPEITRYVVSLLGLERRLSKDKMNALGERITQSQRQLAHYDIISETLVSSLASIYSDLISPLGTPIQVAGDPTILKQTVNQHKIRALLLAGIRSSVLWRQIGGQRRSIIFSRSKIVECAEQLLRTC